MSILINAKEAFKDSGEITLETGLERFVNNKGETREGVIFRVGDNGIGIEQQYLNQIFEPFFSTKNKNLASGLGLTIAKHIIEEHHGKITVESKEGIGTMFNVYLPDARQSVTQIENYEKKTVKNPGAGELIMVVDDEEDLRTMAQKILEKKGFNVLLAESGKEAIEIFQREHNKIHLVILDMIMPGLSGERVYEALKNISTQPKMIITSGYVYNAPFQSIIDSGEVTFIPKPWDLPEFLDVTHRVLNFN